MKDYMQVMGRKIGGITEEDNGNPNGDENEGE